MWYKLILLLIVNAKSDSGAPMTPSMPPQAAKAMSIRQLNAQLFTYQCTSS